MHSRSSFCHDHFLILIYVSLVWTLIKKFHTCIFVLVLISHSAIEYLQSIYRVFTEYLLSIYRVSTEYLQNTDYMLDGIVPSSGTDVRCAAGRWWMYGYTQKQKRCMIYPPFLSWTQEKLPCHALLFKWLYCVALKSNSRKVLCWCYGAAASYWHGTGEWWHMGWSSHLTPGPETQSSSNLHNTPAAIWHTILHAALGKNNMKMWSLQS